MKVDFNAKLIDVRDKKPLIYQTEKGKDKVLTLQHAAGESLIGILQDEQNTSQLERFKRGKLVERIYQTPECELTLEEVVLVKERIGKFYGPLVVVAATKILGE